MANFIQGTIDYTFVTGESSKTFEYQKWSSPKTNSKNPFYLTYDIMPTAIVCGEWGDANKQYTIISNSHTEASKFELFIIYNNSIYSLSISDKKYFIELITVLFFDFVNAIYLDLEHLLFSFFLKLFRTIHPPTRSINS